MIAAAVVIPAALLTWILVRNDHRSGSSVTMTTVIAPYDPSKARVGRLAPDFALPDTNGANVRLSQFRGRAVVLTFFASWCHPCEEELPVLQKLQHEQGARLQVLGVNYQDVADDSRDFVRRLHITFPALLEGDAGDAVAARYGVHGPPLTFFINAQGRIAAAPLYGQGSRKALQPGLDAIFGS